MDDVRAGDADHLGQEGREPHPGVSDARGVQLDRLDVDYEEGGGADELGDHAEDDDGDARVGQRRDDAVDEQAEGVDQQQDGVAPTTATYILRSDYFYNLGGCISHRWHTCFSPSNPRFDFQCSRNFSEEKFSMLLKLIICVDRGKWTVA